MSRTRRVSAALLLLTVTAAGAQTRRRASSPPTPWTANPTAATITTTTGSQSIASSSRIRLSWNAAPGTIHHYAITATESGGVPLSYSATASPFDLGALESATEYTIAIAACLDASCSRTIASTETVKAKTEEEYWQIRGTGRSFATAHRIVSDGNTKPYALYWGAGAGASLEGRAQLYYDPIGAEEKGVKIGTLAAPVTNVDSIASYTPLSGYGFRRGDAAGRAGTGPATFQPVALATGSVRLFYEAEGSDGRGRIYAIDSRDGFVGRDFNRGPATRCEETDLRSGGDCEPLLLIGTDLEGNPRLRAARQFKLGLPLLDDWRWDGSPGSFMIFTAHLTDSTCSATFFNAGHAVFDGSRWNVQYDSNGCPKLIPGVQAPMPVHLGGVRYKLYFNHNTGSAARKPLKILHADGRATGSASLVDFEDWETIATARDVHVLWPDGSELTEEEESMFDDYQVWMPTGDPLVQVIYSNMSCPANACGPPFIGMAVLVNP